VVADSKKQWPSATLGELADQDGGAIAIGPFGSSMKADVYTAEGIPVVRGNNLVGRPGFHGEFVYVSETTAARFPRCLVRPGDLVFPHRGAIGEVGLAIEQGFAQWMLSTSMMMFRPAPEKLDARFTYYFFRSSLGRQQLLQNTSQVGTPGIAQPLSSLRACEIPLPPVPEQQAIADVLWALDDKIEQNRRSSAALERLAQAMFRAWFVDFEPVKAKAAGAVSFPSMPQDIFDALPTRLVDSELGPLPEGWQVLPIGEVVRVKGGATPSTANPEYWQGGTHCWVTPKDMSRLSDPVLLDTERRVTGAGLACISSGLLPVGTVLLSSRAPVGYLAIAAVPTAVNQGFIAMVCNGPLPPVYVLAWAQASMDTIKGRASGTTFPEISKKNFRPIPVLVPPEATVEAYQNIVEPLFHLLIATIKESTKAAQLRDYLLPKLLSGAIRLRVTNA